MTSVNGPHLGEAISALLDGELAPGEVDVAQAHLRSCSVCAAEYEGIASVRAGAVAAFPNPA